ncbi:MAG: CoxG family protein [Gammaproteobacteria bacterium]
MEISGEYLLHSTPETVWAALHDAALLERCVPGCESVSWLDATTVEAGLVLRLGAAKRRYRGRVRIADSRPYESYTLLFGESEQGSSVSARIALLPRADATAVCYAVAAQLDGYLAQLGAPVAVAIARRLAKRFFKACDAELTSDSRGNRKKTESSLS